MDIQIGMSIGYHVYCKRRIVFLEDFFELQSVEWGCILLSLTMI